MRRSNGLGDDLSSVGFRQRSNIVEVCTIGGEDFADVPGSNVARTRPMGEGRFFGPSLPDMSCLVMPSPPVEMRLITLRTSSSRVVPWLSSKAPGRMM